MRSDEQTFSDYLAILRRRWKLAVGVGIAVLLAFVVYAYTETPVYEATAIIQAERPVVPNEMVPTTVASYADEVLATVTQRVLSSENITKVIEKYDLYSPARESVPMDNLVLEFRANTSVMPAIVPALASRTRSMDVTYSAFTVTFNYYDAARTSEVANELARLHISENSSLRAGSATRTTEFLRAEADKVGERLAEVQSKIAALQVRAGGVIASESPMLAAQRYEQLDRELAQVDAGLRAARERKEVFESELIQTPRYRAILADGQTVMRGEDRLIVAQQELVALQARYSDNHPDIVRLKREIAALTGGNVDQSLLASQLRANVAATEQRLAAARETYSDDHPDVVQLRRTLETQQRQLAEAEKSAAGRASQPPPDNPVYLQLQTRIQTAAIEINELSARRAELYRRLSNYSYDPELEAKYSPLARERDQLQQQYEDLRANYTRASLSQSIEAEDKGQVLTLIEPARMPRAPIEPNRPLIMLLGFVLGLGAAFSIAYLLDLLDATVRGSRDIEALLRQAPIAMIPFIDSPGDVVQRRRMHAVYALLALTAIVVVVVVTT